MNITRRVLMKLGLSSLPSSLLFFNWQQKAFAKDESRLLGKPEVLTQGAAKTNWTPFSRKLMIPKELESLDCGDEINRYQIEILPATQTIGKDENVPIWSYNGSTPGPLIRQELNNTSVVRFINKLEVSDTNNEEVPVSIHLHGMASKPIYDGFANDLMYPPGSKDYPDGQYKDYIYPNDRAATIWYHDHAVHYTQRNVAMGMAGMYIVYDPEVEEELKLPGHPGDNPEYDVPLIFQSHPCALNNSNYGNYILVNGDFQPYLNVNKRKYRFRLLNATDTKRLVLMIGTEPIEFYVIASDGGLIPAPVGTSSIRMTPGERYEIVVDFSHYHTGDDVFLFHEGGSKLLKFKIGDEVPDPSCVPETLSQEQQPPDDVTKDPDEILVFNFDNRMAVIGVQDDNDKVTYHYWGQGWPKRRVANPPLCKKNGERGDESCPQVWRIINLSGADHPVHVHLIDTFLIKRYGEDKTTEIEKKPYETGWKDVFLLPPNEAMDIGGFFGPHKGRYMMHCHNLAHEDNDMMVEFQVGGPNDGEPAPIGGQESQGNMVSLRDVKPPSNVYDRERINKFNTGVYGDRQEALERLRQLLRRLRNRL